MGLRWHLGDLLEAQEMIWDELDARLSFPLGSELRGAEPPCDLTLSAIAELCQVLGCQPADLLSFEAETPEEQARRELANSAMYQSFLAYQEALQEVELDDSGR